MTFSFWPFFNHKGALKNSAPHTPRRLAVATICLEAWGRAFCYFLSHNYLWIKFIDGCVLGALISIHYLAKNWSAGLSNLELIIYFKVYHHFNFVLYLTNSIFPLF